MMETWHPLGVVRRDLRLQFPGRGLVLERGAGVGLRRPRGLEAVGEDPADGARRAGASSNAPLRAIRRRARRAVGGADRRPRRRRSAGRPTAECRSSRATGSTAMGRAVGPRLAARFARAILELGGNNAAIVAPSADLDLALRAIAFAAMGTAGQRCTTLRRLFVAGQPSTTQLLAAADAGLRVGSGRRSARRRTLGRPADRPRRIRDHGASAGRGARGRRQRSRRRTRRGYRGRDAYYVRPALCRDAGPDAVRCNVRHSRRFST